MSLAVIGSGFGRTGTASLKRALEKLGFSPCHHMEQVLSHPEQVAHWQAVVAGKPVGWDDVFNGYRSQVDWPGAHVWRELADAYPEAKVIHSVRPEDAWWTSFSATIGKLLTIYKDMPLPPHVAAIADVMEIAIVQQTFRLPAYRPGGRAGRLSRPYRAGACGHPVRAVAGVRGDRRLGAALRVPQRARAGWTVPPHEFDRGVLAV